VKAALKAQSINGGTSPGGATSRGIGVANQRRHIWRQPMAK
jgi:hypothetical protein